MINKIKNMLFYNFKELVTFQTVFKVTSFLIFAPLFLNFFNIIMKITGYEYLTFENLFNFVTNPLVILMLVLLILFMMVYTFFDLSTIIIILDASYQKKKIDIKEVQENIKKIDEELAELYKSLEEDLKELGL